MEGFKAIQNAESKLAVNSEIRCETSEFATSKSAVIIVTKWFSLTPYEI